MFHINDDIISKAREVASQMLEEGNETRLFTLGEKSEVCISTKTENVIVLHTLELEGQVFYVGIVR